MATQPIITRSTVSSIISLLDVMYHWGALHAHRLGDEGAAMEFLESHAEVGVYGFLTDNAPNVGVLEWQLRLIKEARLTSMYGTMYNYLNRAGRYGQNYLSVFYEVAKAMYLRGIRDYYECGGSADMAVFADTKRAWLTSNGIRKVNNTEWVQEIQLICFDEQRKHAAYLETHADDYKAKKVALRGQHFQWFIRAVGLALQKRSD